MPAFWAPFILLWDDEITSDMESNGVYKCIVLNFVDSY